MNPVHVQPAAAGDAEEAVAWYEARRPGLGFEFILELDFAIERIAEAPEMYERKRGGVRRILLRRFPYAVYYLFEASRVEIFAVLHQHRRESVWRSRRP